MVQDNAPTSVTDDREHSWQLRLMPFMIGIILMLALFFFAATMYQLYELNSKIQQVAELQNTELLEKAVPGSSLMEKQWRSLVVLESHILRQRYHQANVLLMARVWIQYLGFVTGMMLSLIGAVFILGKLREPATELTLGSGAGQQKLPSDLKMHLVTQSPGIVLVTLGTVLMLVTILVHHPIEVTDKPVYTSVTTAGKTTAPAKPPELTPDSNVKPDQPLTVDTPTLLEQARARHKVEMEEAPK